MYWTCVWNSWLCCTYQVQRVDPWNALLQCLHRERISIHDMQRTTDYPITKQLSKQNIHASKQRCRKDCVCCTTLSIVTIVLTICLLSNLPAYLGPVLVILVPICGCCGIRFIFWPSPLHAAHLPPLSVLCHSKTPLLPACLRYQVHIDSVWLWAMLSTSSYTLSLGHSLLQNVGSLIWQFPLNMPHPRICQIEKVWFLDILRNKLTLRFRFNLILYWDFWISRFGQWRKHLLRMSGHKLIRINTYKRWELNSCELGVFRF